MSIHMGMESTASPSAATKSMMKSAIRGDAKGVRSALFEGADPLAMTGHSFGSALMMAAKSGSAECVAALLPVSDLSATDQERRGALDWARLGPNSDIGPMIAAFKEAAEIGEQASKPSGSKPAPKPP